MLETLRGILMPTATSAAVQKDFARFKDLAKREPVVVTQHGRPAVVIVAAEEYRRLTELDRRARRLDARSDVEIEEMLAAGIPADHQYSIADIPD